MTQKQQSKAFQIALSTLDRQWNSIVTSNMDPIVHDEFIDLITVNFVNTTQQLFPTSTANQINYIINNEFDHILELKFDKFYDLLNNIEIINKVR